MLGRDDQQLVGGNKHRDRMRPMPVTVTGVSCVSTIWIIATFAILSGLIVAGGFPKWIKNRVEPGPQSRDLGNNALSSVDLGLFYLCYNLTGCTQVNCDGVCRDQRLCGCYTYMGYNPPANFTSENGQVHIVTKLSKPESIRDYIFLFSGSMVYAFGCLLLLISLLIGVVAYCKPRFGSCSLFLLAFVLQAVAGKLLIHACYKERYSLLHLYNVRSYYSIS